MQDAVIPAPAPVQYQRDRHPDHGRDSGAGHRVASRLTVTRLRDEMEERRRQVTTTEDAVVQELEEYLATAQTATGSS
jgi:hypothetical protein